MRTTFLQHTLPDGSWHIDWLIEVEPGEQPRLPTFRLADRPDREGVQSFAGELLPDHRRRYLDYEGPVSGNRGHVRTVAQGDVIAVTGWPESLDVTVVLRHDGARWRWQGRPVAEAHWRFEAVALRD